MTQAQTIESILSTRLPYNELLSRLEEYVRMKEREAAERAWWAADECRINGHKGDELSNHLKQYEK